MSNFNAYSKYYDLLYHDKNYEAESNYIEAHIKKFKPDAKTILELGSGSGNHAAFLCKNGFEVTGIERSEAMVKLATEKHINGFTPVCGDISSYSVDKKFDVAISLFHVISYLTSNSQLMACFKATHHHLKPEGIFIFDIWYTPAVYLQKPETRIKRLEDDVVNVVRIAESTMHVNSNRVDVQFEVHVQQKSNGITEILKETHPMRHFSIPEIELLAMLTGFRTLHTEEFLSGNTPSATTWGVCFVLQKIN